MARAASTNAEKMIKVDHAGENGAVNIYRAQHLLAHLRCPSLKLRLKEFQRHEEEHRAIFAQHLKKIGVKRCVSYHLNGFGGFALGFVTGIIGPSAIAATTYAVEDVVITHLEHQMSYLKNASQETFLAVSAIYEDEKSHHEAAKSDMNSEKFISRTIVTIIKRCTEAVIWFGMR